MCLYSSFRWTLLRAFVTSSREHGFNLSFVRSWDARELTHSTIPANYAAARCLLHARYHYYYTYIYAACVRRGSRRMPLALRSTAAPRFVNCAGSLIRGDNDEREVTLAKNISGSGIIDLLEIIDSRLYQGARILLQSNSIPIQLPSISLNLSAEKHFHITISWNLCCENTCPASNAAESGERSQRKTKEMCSTPRKLVKFIFNK